MVFAALLFGLCEVAGFVGLALFLRHLVNAKQAEIERRLTDAAHDWLDPGPPDEKGNPTPSKAAQVSAAVGEVVGKSAAQSIMGSLAADRSHVSRVANGVADELQGQMNPVMGLLTGGRRGKGAAIAQLAQVLGGMLGPRNNHDAAESRSVVGRLRGGDR